MHTKKQKLASAPPANHKIFENYLAQSGEVLFDKSQAGC
jgi:hypothetical protein